MAQRADDGDTTHRTGAAARADAATAVRNMSQAVAGSCPIRDDGRMTSAPLGIPEHLFTAIDHVGIAVPDLDVAMAFYRDSYGMTVVHEETNEEQGVREAMVAVGDSGSCIQLLAPLSESSTIAKFLERSGPGLQQLAFRVTDIEAVAAVLRARGLRLLYDAPKRGTSDSRVNFVHPKDAGGVLVELVEPAADATH
jgi:methylmalonyl-CoA/ethylmalonyl-CoA epimerase